MKSNLFLILLVLILAACSQTPTSEISNNDQQIEIDYDSVLAKKLGADDYGMRQYVIAFLKRGPNRSQDSAEAANLQRAHLDNIGRLAKEGKLALAGPFLDGGDLRGIYIFNVKTIAEAEELTKSDPAIQQGRLVMELHPWYGSAALLKVNELHNKIAKINI